MTVEVDRLEEVDALVVENYLSSPGRMAGFPGESDTWVDLVAVWPGELVCGTDFMSTDSNKRTIEEGTIGVYRRHEGKLRLVTLRAPYMQHTDGIAERGLVVALGYPCQWNTEEDNRWLAVTRSLLVLDDREALVSGRLNAAFFDGAITNRPRMDRSEDPWLTWGDMEELATRGFVIAPKR